MINIQKADLHFGDQVIFDSISCMIEKQHKIGLVGRNGAGKSTLLKALAKQISLDSGTIEIAKNFTIAYMSQEVVITSDKTVFEETLTTFDYIFKLVQEKKILEKAIHNHPTEHEINRYSEIEYELFELNLDEKKVKAKKILTGLGFNDKKQQTKVSELSVGWRMRVVLAKLLLQDADFYLFDEPTNHLDLSTKNWFLNFLQNSSFGYLLVCHDRYFLDKACNITFELFNGILSVYQGNYSYYQQQKELKTEQLEQAFKKQQQEIKQKERTIDRFRSKSSKAKMVQSMIKSLNRIEKIELESQAKNINIKLQTPKQSGKLVLKVNNVSHSFEHQLFKNASFEVERNDKIALIAPNGTGKTTLFNLIAKKLSLQNGAIEFGHNVITSLFDQDQEKVLDPEKTILEEVSNNCDATEQQIRTILGSFLFNQDDIAKKTSVLSGGERNRVAMAKVILSKANFLLLDEPTNHLDIESKEIILNALQAFQGTILFVSHDQDFVNELATKIIALDENGTCLYLGNYDSYLNLLNNNSQSESKSKQQTRAFSNEKPASKEIFMLQKQCKNLENKITKHEQKLHHVLEKMGTAQYGTPDYEKLENEYQKLQEMITLDTDQWESLLIKIDEGTQ